MSLLGNSDCRACELHQSAQSICLMGKGSKSCKVMIVGEAPGFREDDIGKPFAGKAGQLLDNVLREVGLSRENCYITNVVKCRPPENRTPKVKEIKACSGYLEKEFKTIKPKYVILLGAVPLKAVLNKAKITENHGKVFEKDGRYYLPTFHPAAALRDPKRLDPIKADFEIFARMIKTGKVDKGPKLNLTTIETFDDFNSCIDDIRNSREVSFDIETTELNRFGEKEYVNCLGLATPQGEWILPLGVMGSPFRKHSIQKQMVELIAIAMRGKKVIAHNGKFDNLWLRFRYGVRFPITFDTILASHLLDENSPNGLTYLSRAFFKAPDYDLPLRDKQRPNTMKKVRKLFVYCAYDVHYTLKLYYLFKEKLKQDKALLKLFKHLVMPLSKFYEDAEEEGITIDTEKLDVVEKDLLRELADAEKKLAAYTPGKKVNWNSPQQVARVLFGDWKLTPLGKTPAGNDSTGETILLQLRDKHPGVEALLHYREKRQQYTHFVKGWKKRMYKGKLHPSYKIFGTVTGRPSCVDPNLQQTPRDSTIRSLIIAPEGWELVELDQSQVELRISAMLSGERTMKFIFQTGGDIHTTTAQEVSGKLDITKEERKKAKAVNFGFVYGMGWRKFMEYARDKYGVKLTPSQSKGYRGRFFEKYADLPQWHRKQIRLAHANQQVRTPTGRIRRLPSILSTEDGIRAEAERQSINSPVQGFAAEVTLMGALEIASKFSKRIVRPIGTVHDAVLALVKKGYVNKVLPKSKRMMEEPKLLEKLGVRMTVPLVVEAKVGPWGSGKEYEFKAG